MSVAGGNFNQPFADLLSKFSYSASLYGTIKLSYFIRTTDDREVFREFIYSVDQIRLLEALFFYEKAILYSRNDAVDRLNCEVAQLTNSFIHKHIPSNRIQRVKRAIIIL